jgi:hypothetical protein
MNHVQSLYDQCNRKGVQLILECKYDDTYKNPHLASFREILSKVVQDFPDDFTPDDEAQSNDPLLTGTTREKVIT